jgi:serpin B
VQALELPYRGHALSMWVLLPKERNGLGAFEKSLTADALRDLTMRAASREVIVSMPRFKMTQEFSLSDTLKAMGMKDAFAAGKADFSGMTDKDDLYLQTVVHKAYVDVMEEGTEAAAATGVAIGVTSMPVRQEPVVFKADHPFVFLIRHNATGAILFIGRLSDPSV